jgi:dTDP-4-amino-4,6-dideoxygalactose transaminase
MIPRASIPISSKEIAALLSGIFVSEDKGIFENDLATYLNVKKTFAFNSGRTALQVAMTAMNLKPGEEVIVPAYTCAIVFEVILRLDLKPVLIDVNPATCNIDAELIKETATSKTRVVIPVHLFGRPCEMDQIMEVANRHDLYVIEDAAQALGAEFKKAKAGTFGDLAIFSFGPGKSITSGEGGAIAVNNDELTGRIMDVQLNLKNPNLRWSLRVAKNIAAMKLFSNPMLFTFIRDYLEDDLKAMDREILENCLNLRCQEHNTKLHPTIELMRMPVSSAKIARMQLKKLDEFNKRRIVNAITLNELLDGVKDHAELPEVDDHVKNTFTRYPLKLVKGSRDGLMKRLLEGGIDTEKPYNYLNELWESFSVKAPNARRLANSIITIPNHPQLRESDTMKIANTLLSELTRHKAYENHAPK